MIIGIGTDIVRIDRIERIIEKYGKIFLTRILCEQEMERLEQLTFTKHANFLAKRFAAKEAISKAFGVGIGEHLQFKSITIANDESGKPLVRVSSTKIKDIEQFNIHLSMSDDYPNALAFVVLTKRAAVFC